MNSNNQSDKRTLGSKDKEAESKAMLSASDRTNKKGNTEHEYLDEAREGLAGTQAHIVGSKDRGSPVVMPGRTQAANSPTNYRVDNAGKSHSEMSRNTNSPSDSQVNSDAKSYFTGNRYAKSDFYPNDLHYLQEGKQQNDKYASKNEQFEPSQGSASYTDNIYTEGFFYDEKRLDGSSKNINQLGNIMYSFGGNSNQDHIPAMRNNSYYANDDQPHGSYYPLSSRPNIDSRLQKEPHQYMNQKNMRQFDSINYDGDSGIGTDRVSGKKKIKLEYIRNKPKRGVTFSKRKKGIMKKAFELSVLTGSEILLVIANETGHVYTYATTKLKPVLQRQEAFIKTCLGSNDIAGYVDQNIDNLNSLDDRNFSESGSDEL